MGSRIHVGQLMGARHTQLHKEAWFRESAPLREELERVRQALLRNPSPDLYDQLTRLLVRSGVHPVREVHPLPLLKGYVKYLEQDSPKTPEELGILWQLRDPTWPDISVMDVMATPAEVLPEIRVDVVTSTFAIPTDPGDRPLREVEGLLEGSYPHLFSEVGSIQESDLGASFWSAEKLLWGITGRVWVEYDGDLEDLPTIVLRDAPTQAHPSIRARKRDDRVELHGTWWFEALGHGGLVNDTSNPPHLEKLDQFLSRFNIDPQKVQIERPGVFRIWSGPPGEGTTAQFYYMAGYNRALEFTDRDRFPRVTGNWQKLTQWVRELVSQ